jgi:hypothetical protein
MPTQTDMPEICGVTSLGRYLVTNRGDWDQFIFPGKEQYERFRNILKTIVDRHSEEIQRMGIDLSEKDRQLMFVTEPHRLFHLPQLTFT